MTDAELFDLIGVPEERRPYLQRVLHSISREYFLGPNRYTLCACILNAVMERGGNDEIFNLRPMFDVSEWYGPGRTDT